MRIEGFEYYLNVDSGEVVTLGTYDRDEALNELIEEEFNEVYFRVPERHSSEGYSDMEDFAETVDDGKLRVALFSALNKGRKVFRSFKDALYADDQELERYYQFIQTRNEERIRDWLSSINIKVIEV